MLATTGDHRASRRRVSLVADRARMHNLAASDGKVNWQLLEALGRKGQRIVSKHHEVCQLPCCDAAERLLLEARVGGIDGLAAQGLLQGERLAGVHPLAAEGLVRHRGAEVAQRI